MRRILGIVVLCGVLAWFVGGIGTMEHREMLSWGIQEMLS